MAEWLVGHPDRPDPRASLFNTSSIISGPGNFGPFTAACRDLAFPAGVMLPMKPAFWMSGEYGSTLLNHAIAINGHTCLNGGNVHIGAWTAGSRHADGVNVVFLDGHARFLRDTINLAVWRALGTRNGQEIISNTSY